MSDIKVKAYGILPLKKKTYLFIQTIGAIVLISGIIVSLVFNSPDNTNGFIRYLYSQGYMQYLLWICLGVFVLEAFETYFMLKKYNQKES